MDKNLEKHAKSRHQVAPAALLPSMVQEASSVAGSPAAGLALGREHPGLRLPPTRAARASRSRGVFLKEPDEAMGAGRPRWVESLVAFVAVAAAALLVCIGAPSVVAGAVNGTNPGPGIVAAASVAPPFVLPTKLR